MIDPLVPRGILRDHDRHPADARVEASLVLVALRGVARGVEDGDDTRGEQDTNDDDGQGDHGDKHRRVWVRDYRETIMPEGQIVSIGSTP